MKWIGPYTVDQLLERELGSGCPEPPEADGVYLVSRGNWSGRPTGSCSPLFAGANTGKSARFRTRIGDLIADMFGFYTDESAHSSGGMSLHDYCRSRRLNPKTLYIGWMENCCCVRCSHNDLYDELHPVLNKVRPAKCDVH